jgi:hypothetical protein
LTTLDISGSRSSASGGNPYLRTGTSVNVHEHKLARPAPRTSLIPETLKEMEQGSI